MKLSKPALRRFAILLPTAWILNSSLQATNYYVSTNGFDSANGSITAPWKTIQRAANMMQAGDTAIISPGFYNERITTRTDGNATNRITFVSPGRNTSCKGFYVANDYVTIDGFVMTNGYFSQWEFDGAINLTKSADYCWMLNNRFTDFEKISTATNQFYCISFDYSATAAAGQQNCVISNNVFRNTTYVQIKLGGAQCEVVNNVFDKANERDAMHVFGRGHHIASNVFTNFQSDPIIQDHCDIFQTFGDEDAESFDILIEKNLIVNCQGAQLCQLEQKGRPNIRDWTFRNNVWINVGMAANIDIENCKWINNTFYRCTQNTGHTLLLNDNVKGTARNAVVVNNIFFECGSVTNNPDYGYYGTETKNFPFTADYNYVCGTAYSAKSLKYFTEAHGINGGNPRFRNAQTGDVSLSSASPLLDKGQPQSDFDTDINDIPRPQGSGWEMGAYEFAPPMAVLSNGTLIVQFLVDQGGSYSLQKTTNFVDWFPVLTSVVATNRLLRYEDSNPSTPNLFYRAIRFD